MTKNGFPKATGLYNPRHEHDACGVGFVANIHGEQSHNIIKMGLRVLENLTHRGAAGSDPLTGDGAGILMQIPDTFLRNQCTDFKLPLPPIGEYGVGMIFLPKEPSLRASCCRVVEQVIAEEGQFILGWRDVPINPTSGIGYVAKASEPFVKQVFIGQNNRPENADPDWFERRLFMVRRRIENAVIGYDTEELKAFHIASLSSRTLLYKGMFLAAQLPDYYQDLLEADVISAFAMVHQRYSTNTFPTWDLAQPFRMIGHNGEINTLRGNINWMRAREAALSSEIFGKDIRKLFPIVPEGISDSASFDRALEFLVLSGRSLPHAMMMLIPEAWENHQHMSEKQKGFYEYHASMMEPWDGPAAVAFTDGRTIGATLDRNGLRPARYLLTKSGICVMASEDGTITFPPEEIQVNGRLQPGRMFIIDLEKKRIIDDKELKKEIVESQPYDEWVSENMIDLKNLPKGEKTPEEQESLKVRQKLFAYTEEDLHTLLGPMAVNGQEPVGSMGNDAALAVLSNRPVLLFNYFRQLFAQVTNPPIDPIREELVMSLYMQLGPVGNLLEETPDHAKRLRLKNPILTDAELAKIRDINTNGLKAETFSILFPFDEGEAGMDKALRQVMDDVVQSVTQSECNLVILSDRNANNKNLPIPSLLAVSAVHHHLIRSGLRSKASIILESAEPREVAHFALLVGYGAGAINPYLAFETLTDMAGQKRFSQDITAEVAHGRYIKALKKGLLKTFSKMGISTLQSYCGAQIFEIVGINSAVTDRFFTGTTPRIEGIGLKEIAQEAIKRYNNAYGQTPQNLLALPLDLGGDYQFRHGGERHMWTPETITKLQHATSSNNYKTYQEFATLINAQNRQLCTLRGLFKLKKGRKTIPLDEVEPASEIVKRFVTGAMSFGSISKEAHETLAIAMNRINGMSNTGEGGEDPERFKPRPNGDLARSAIKQVASGRFGVSSHYLANADEIQIKIAQGAKPGEGGQLPGHKVNAIIAKTRNTTPGVTLISPPPHHDIYSIEDLAQLIFDLKNVNPKARISVKLVSAIGVGTIAAGVSKGHADMILIAGHDGGTGASPLSSVKHTGSPWELGLAETQQTLVLNDLRGRVRLQVDGQLRTGRDVVIGALLGAEEFGFATAPLIVEGCIMMRKCHLGTCPVGIATQNPSLRKKFTGQPQHVVNYFFFVANEVREILSEMGMRSLDKLIGRVDLIEIDQAIDHWKAKGLNFSRILEKPDVPSRVAIRCVQQQDHGIDKILDHKLIQLADIAFNTKEPIEMRLPIHNTDRTVGAMLGGEISKRFGKDGLPEDTIKCYFRGIAGQSFGAFNVRGVSLHLEGSGNDYVGKGMSGGRIVIHPPKKATFNAADNIIVGNTVLYGAIRGEAFFSGVAGERFAVRNSGAHAVVEGLGDHGCEYMTGGIVVVLGSTGRNFAAGMSGGIAYVLDEDEQFTSLCNQTMVELGAVNDPKEQEQLKELVTRHQQFTQSERAERLLNSWDTYISRFVKVLPLEYKRVLEEMKEKQRKVVNG
ncbi:glutamate synthase large subunit [Magnetococcales bacterium HHB-1]